MGEMQDVILVIAIDLDMPNEREAAVQDFPRINSLIVAEVLTLGSPDHRYGFDDFRYPKRSLRKGQKRENDSESIVSTENYSLLSHELTSIKVVSCSRRLASSCG